MHTKNIFFDYFENLAPTYTRYRKRFGYYWRDIINYFNYFINQNDSVLEIGCGTGTTLAGLNGTHKTGIDFSPAMISQAKMEHPELEFYVMEAENITLNKKFDVVIISNVIGYFDNVSDVLPQIQKVCHSGTRIFISYYNYLWEPVLKIGEWLGFKKRLPRQNWLSIHDIENLLY